MRKKSLISSFMFLLLFTSFATVANEKPTNRDTPAMPENVKAIIENKCFGCHNTDSRNEDAKEKLDFKTLDDLSLMKKITAYKHVGETLEKNEMPPVKFLEKRPEKALTDEEKNILMTWAKNEAEALVNSK